MWITEYPAASIDNAKKVYSTSELAGMEAGLIALYHGRIKYPEVRERGLAG